MATFKEELESVELLHHLQAMITYKAWSDYLFFLSNVGSFLFLKVPPANYLLIPEPLLAPTRAWT